MIGIYKITSPTGRVYVGQSLDIGRRFKEYRSLHRCIKDQPLLYNSLVKHGVNNHLFEVICECSIEELNALERSYQEQYDVLKKGLNCILVSTESSKQVFSEEYRRKLSEAGKKKVFTEGHKKNLSISGKKKTFSEEHRRKLSESKKGKQSNAQGKRWSKA